MGPLVKLYRTARLLTQRQLAEAAGVSLGTLRDLEQGRLANARWETVESVAVALDIDPRQRAALMEACRAESPALAASSAEDHDSILAPVRVEVLGPLIARRYGSAVPLGSLRQRAVLGLLALHGGVRLHRDAIIDALWGAKPPPSAVTQVHGYVSRLRRLLAPEHDDPVGADLVATVGAGYRLQARPGQLDLASFQQTLDRADRLAAQNRLEQACDLYEGALGLWRGDVLADIDLLREHPAATELVHRRSDAVVRFGDLALRTGAPHRALPSLRELCARESFNEAAHAYLMVALAGTGQQASALDAFARLRRRLIDELGINPGPQLMAAHGHVLRQHAV